MKRGALLVVWILVLASLAIMEAAAPPVRAQPADRVDPGEIADRTAQPVSNPCSQAKIDEVLSPPRVIPGVPPQMDRNANVDCNLKLRPSDVVTRTLRMAGPASSGITVDCNGAKIDGRRWSDKEAIVVESSGGVVENVTVRNCNVEGRVRVAGGGGSTVNLPNHTELIQARSPKNIVFDRLNITAHGKDPFYVFSGAMRVTLMNSRIGGRSDGVAIYLDAESAENVLRNNDFNVDTKRREQLAIDGSARNQVVGNRFSRAGNGGIFIYRNCGEKGGLRHQFPADNVILDNVFAAGLVPVKPIVWIASRQNQEIGLIEDIWKDNLCNDDEGQPKYGSNLDNLDHAYRTVVALNRFVGFDPNKTVSLVLNKVDPIKVDDDPSYVFNNVRDDRPRGRNASCFVANGYPSPMVAHGKSIAVFDNGSGPRCTGQRLSCDNGTLRPSRAICASELASRLTVVSFGCRVQGNNRGCEGRAVCPRGTTAVAIKAACDLENGDVTDEQFVKTPWSFAGVVKRSDDASDGVCAVGGVDVSERGAVLGSLRANQVPFSCREHDRNGGDCQVRGALTCSAGGVFEN